MTVWFVTRHAGAVEWARDEGMLVDRVVEHFDPDWADEGDQVLGTLPVNLVAILNARGVTYRHLVLELPSDMRGKELSAQLMRDCGARLVTYRVVREE